MPLVSRLRKLKIVAEIIGGDRRLLLEHLPLDMSAQEWEEFRNGVKELVAAIRSRHEHTIEQARKVGQ